MSKSSPDLFAVIHVGSEQVGIQIVEYTGLNDIKIIEMSSRQVGLGEETFKTGKISFSTVNEICELLKGYRRMLVEYGVKDYRLVATTAVREAVNQHYIIDQIKVKTGFSVEVVDMPREIYYKYVALLKTIQTCGLANEQESLLFVDISSGGLGLTLYKDGGISYQQNIHIGALRIKESFDKQQRESAHFHQALAEYIYSTVEPVQQALSQHKIKCLVLSGIETRLLKKILGMEQMERLTDVSLSDFYQLYDKVKTLNLPQIMSAFRLSEQKAELVLPTIVLYKQILGLADIGGMVIPSDHFSDGVSVLHIAEKTQDKYLYVLEEQIISLARSLGCKYQYEPRHASCVEKMSLLLFDRLVKVHGLGRRERLFLQVAAILHDIGKFVSVRRHYFYSYRLIISSDIFGFSEDEKAVIANIAHYHSKITPSPTDANFTALTKKQKVTMAKLAAIIRLADALDRSHCQKVTGCEIALKGDELLVKVAAKDDISLEEWTFQEKADFFEDVFGIKPILIRQAG